MIRHIFMMLRHQNRKYFVIAAEMALVFFILLWSMTSLFDTIKKYRSPGMLDTENVVILGCVETSAYVNRVRHYKPFPFMNNIMEKIKTKEYVECMVESLNFTPYINEDSNLNWRISIGNGEKFFCALRAVDGDAEGVYKPKLLEGKWLGRERSDRGYETAVVTQQFVKEHELENPIGTTVNLEGNIYEIVGVLDGFKNNPIEESEPTVVFPLNGFMFQKGCDSWREFGVRVKPGYEEKLIDDFYNEFKLARNGTFTDVIPLIYDSSTLKSRTMKDAVTELAFVGIPTIFLLIFTVLGMIGVNLLDVKSRMQEFALRISVGATSRNIVFMIFIQNLIVGLLSLIPGTIIILTVNDFAVTSLCALGGALAVVLLLSVVVVIYPAVLLSKINPSELLKEE